MRRFGAIAVLALGMAMAGEAQASGGLSCEGSAGKISFEVGAAVTRGMGGAVFQFNGTIETTDKTIEDDMRKVQFEKEHLAQYWLDGKEMRLLMYRERIDGDHGYVELTILTKAGKGDDEGTYNGKFEATWFETKNDTSAEGKTVKVGGKVECFVE